MSRTRCLCGWSVGRGPTAHAFGPTMDGCARVPVDNPHALVYIRLIVKPVGGRCTSCQLWAVSRHTRTTLPMRTHAGVEQTLLGSLVMRDPFSRSPLMLCTLCGPVWWYDGTFMCLYHLPHRQSYTLGRPTAGCAPTGHITTLRHRYVLWTTDPWYHAPIVVWLRVGRATHAG